MRRMHSPRSALLTIVLVGTLAAFTTACSGDEGKPSGGSSGTPAAEGGADAAPSEAGAGKTPNASPCTKNEDCQSNVCFVGGTQSYCSVKCSTGDAVTLCAAPLTGSCNKQGYCKRD